MELSRGRPHFIFIIGKSFDKLADYRQTFQDLYAMRRLVRDFFRQFIAGRQSIFVFSVFPSFHISDVIDDSIDGYLSRLAFFTVV